MKVKELVEKLLNHLDPSAEIETVMSFADDVFFFPPLFAHIIFAASAHSIILLPSELYCETNSLSERFAEIVNVE